MRYLFFDCEAANCFEFVDKICTFGYCITDTSFACKSKIDVIINPEAEFDKHIISQKMNAYPISKYGSSPNFCYFYPSIKNLLENDEQIVVGWSIENDVRYIISSCKRYDLKQIKYKYFDVQKVYQLYSNIDHQPSLELACTDLKIDVLTTHKSDDDAYMTMLVTKKICERLKISLSKLIEKYPSCLSSVDQFSKTLKSDEEKQRLIALREANTIIKRAKRLGSTQSNNIMPDDVFSFTTTLKEKYGSEIKKLVYFILDRGARCTINDSMANKIVCLKSEESRIRRTRLSQTKKIYTTKQLLDD